MTFVATAAFGILGASLAALSFADARALFAGLFHGPSLIGAVGAAGFGCWIYIFLALPRFAAKFSPAGGAGATGADGFSELVRFYGRAGAGLVAVFAVAQIVAMFLGARPGGVLLCLSGGAAAAAAFQTVLAFVPAGDPG